MCVRSVCVCAQICCTDFSVDLTINVENTDGILVFTDAPVQYVFLHPENYLWELCAECHENPTGGLVAGGRS